MSLREKVEKTIYKFRMLDKGDELLVGVSGGPDSVCLLYILYALKEKWDLKLHIAHLNHRLRGKDSDEDALFVKNMAEELKLPFYLKEVDTREEVKRRRLSEEEGARILRYEFFLETANKLGLKKISLGHTRDDQVETVLMRIIKGAGLLGLRGIPPLREERGILIIRPLWEVWREEIIKYLEEESLGYRFDKSNLEESYLRNRIRNELIPYILRDFNPRFKEVLANTAENLTLAYEYITKQAKRKFNSIVERINGKIIIKLDKLKTFPAILQREIFRQTVRELKGNLRRINYQHWKEFEALFRERPSGSVLNLPQGISIEKNKKKLIFFIGESE